jgi:hypothetical protein
MDVNWDDNGQAVNSQLCFLFMHNYSFGCGESISEKQCPNPVEKVPC